MPKLKYRRMAVVVGINYSGTSHPLHGCINDAKRIRDFLVRNYDFPHDQVRLLTDERGSTCSPTYENISMALRWLIAQAELGDVALFYFSGHGTRVSHQNPGPYVPGDQAIVPSDGNQHNLITSTHFRQLVDSLRSGVILTVISDSCHSGGLIGQEKEQIGPATTARATTASGPHRSKFIPFESLEEPRTRTNTSDTRTHSGYISRQPDQGILLSGCQANEVSIEVGSGAQAHGVFTSAMLTLLEDALQRRTLPLHRDLVQRTRQKLQQQGYTQHPCLYCSDGNRDHGISYPVYYAHTMK